MQARLERIKACLGLSLRDDNRKGYRMSEVNKTNGQEPSKRSPITPSEEEIESLYLRWCEELDSGQTRTLEEWLRETPEHLHEEFWNILEIESISRAAEQEEVTIPPEVEARFDQLIHETVERYFPTSEGTGIGLEGENAEGEGGGLEGELLSLTRLQKLLIDKQGLDQWARELHLPIPIFYQLLRALLRPKSIPEFVYQKLAEATELPVEQIRASFAQSRPSFSPRMAFRAEAAPQLPDQKDFWETLFSEPSLSEEDRKFWEGMRPG